MRVTSNSFTNQFLDQVRQLSARQNRLQLQAATGKRIQTADEDPTAMRKVLDLQAQAAAMAQYQKNISSLNDKADSAYNVMRGLKTISDRASELATLASGTRSPQELAIYGAEINQLLQQAAQSVNSKFPGDGDYLFGGTRTDQPPFTLTRDSNNRITAVTYQGNVEGTEVEIASGSLLSVQVPGANTTGNGTQGLVADSRTGADFFAHLIQLRDHLMTGDAAAVAAIAATDRPALVKDGENFVMQMGTNAALQARLEAAASSAVNKADAVSGLISQESDADMAETLVQLNKTQTAYQAALQSGASIMQLSLLNYLK